MFKIYDTEHNFLMLLPQSISNVQLHEVLETGLMTLNFSAPCANPFLSVLKEEYYIESPDYEFVIKTLEYTAENYINVSCKANVEEIEGRIIRVFDVFAKSVEQAYEYCLNSVVGWSLEYNSSVRTLITLQQLQTTAWDMLKTIAEQNGQELWFDTKNKIVKVYDTMGRIHSNVYYSNEINLRRSAGESNTFEYATVLYPIGKDGLTIKDVNNGIDYIENFTYSTKRIEKWWINEEIDRAEILKMKAEEYLAEIANPVANYTIDLCELGDNIQLGDTIIIVDKIKHFKLKKRVVAIHRFPYEPELSSVELAKRQDNLARMLLNDQKATDKKIAYIRSLLDKMRT